MKYHTTHLILSHAVSSNCTAFHLIAPHPIPSHPTLLPHHPIPSRLVPSHPHSAAFISPQPPTTKTPRPEIRQGQPGQRGQTASAWCTNQPHRLHRKGRRSVGRTHGDAIRQGTYTTDGYRSSSLYRITELFILDKVQKSGEYFIICLVVWSTNFSRNQKKRLNFSRQNS